MCGDSPISVLFRPRCNSGLWGLGLGKKAASPTLIIKGLFILSLWMRMGECGNASTKCGFHLTSIFTYYPILRRPMRRFRRSFFWNYAKNQKTDETFRKYFWLCWNLMGLRGETEVAVEAEVACWRSFDLWYINIQQKCAYNLGSVKTITRVAAWSGRELITT